MPVEEFRKIAEGTKCKILASLETAEMPVLKDTEATSRIIRAAAMGYWTGGADGIQVFNMHLPIHYFRQGMPYLKEIGSLDTLEGLDKHYIVTRSSNFDDVAPFSYSKELPAVLKSDSDSVSLHIRIGDDLAARKPKRVTLRFRIMGLTSRDKLDFAINGSPLDAGTARRELFPAGESGGVSQYSFMAEAYYGHEGPYHWIEFELQPDQFPHVGINDLTVCLRERNPKVTEPITVNDAEILVEYP
jgi:hypothetical protein